MADSTPVAEALTAATNHTDWSPAVAAVSAITVEWFQPLNVFLVVAIVMFARFMHKANQRPDFNLVDALRGPDGKCSMKLIGYLVAIIGGTWAVMDAASSWLQQPIPFVYLFVAYMGLLVAPKIVAELIQAKYRASGGGKEEDRRAPDERRPGS